jgi:signal transduction histidine kinase
VPLAQAKNISIDNTVTKCKAKTNHDGLVSVLTILLENAIKYSPGNSDIAVSNNTKGSFVELKVSDNGVGIAPEDQEKIFDRFYRSDDSRSKEHVEGYGLGLSLARRIIGEMEGSIRVSSKLGKGSTFTVQLPKEV